MHRATLLHGLVSCFALAAFVSRPGAAEPDQTKMAVTFSKDIAPIIYKNCTSCHRPGEVAPFALLTYADVRKRAKQIARVTASRTMPPWKAEPSDLNFVGDRRLSREEMEKIQQWAKADAPEGNPADLPKPPSFTEGWQLGKPDLIVTMSKAYTVPAEGPDVYRNFGLTVPVPAGKYIKGLEFRPGNRRVVHHAVLSTLTGAARLQDNGDGKSGGITPLGQILPGGLGIWAPGNNPLPLPADFALPWTQETQLVLQLHLHPSGKEETEQSSVGFYFTSEPPQRKLWLLPIMNKNVLIPPGEPTYRLKKSFTLPLDLEVYGQFPHMHLLGKEIKAVATLPGGATRQLLWIKDWDFSWQTYYQLKQPFTLPKGTRIDVEWTFDNSAANPRNPSQPPRLVTYGEQTTNEMAVFILDVARAGAGIAPRR